MELDALNESFGDRQDLINKIEASGRSYNFDKYSDAQLYRMWQRIQDEDNQEREYYEMTREPEQDVEVSFCDYCGLELNPLGQCPECDLGDRLDEDVKYCWFGYYLDRKNNKKFIYAFKDNTSLDADEAADMLEDMIPEPYTKFVFRGSIDSFLAEKEGYALVENLLEWKLSDGSSISKTSVATSAPSATTAKAVSATQQVQKQAASAGKYIVTIVDDGHKLRARADDGVHGEANVAFPNNLRNHEGQQYEVEILTWNGKNYRASGEINPVNSVSNTQNINEKINKENNKMNFFETLDELNKLYEATNEEALADEVAAEEEIPVEDVVDDEVVKEEPEVDEPKKVILECSKCGALVIKDESDVKADEESDLVNVDEACAFCEETAGYAIVGAMVPYKAAEEIEEGLFGKKIEKTVTADKVKKGDKILAVGGRKEQYPGRVQSVSNRASGGGVDIFHSNGSMSLANDTEVRVLTKESLEEEVSLTEGKLKDSLKKVATRLGADGATVIRAFGELISNILPEKQGDALYDAVENMENKATLKALMNGNEKVLNTLTVEDIDELKQDIEEYAKTKAAKKAGKADDSENLDEILDVNLDLDARGFGGKGNDVSVL